MSRARWLALALAPACAASFGAACSLVEPQVGILLPQCSAASQTPSGGYGYGYGGTPASAQPAAVTPPATCEPDAGDPCESCENARCCNAHLACEGDSLCACADSVLDSCLDALGPAASNRADPRVRQCWDSFAAASVLTQAYVDCARASCGDVCFVP